MFLCCMCKANVVLAFILAASRSAMFGTGWNCFILSARYIRMEDSPSFILKEVKPAMTDFVLQPMLWLALKALSQTNKRLCRAVASTAPQKSLKQHPSQQSNDASLHHPGR